MAAVRNVAYWRNGDLPTCSSKVGPRRGDCRNIGRRINYDVAASGGRPGLIASAIAGEP